MMYIHYMASCMHDNGVLLDSVTVCLAFPHTYIHSDSRNVWRFVTGSMLLSSRDSWCSLICALKLVVHHACSSPRRRGLETSKVFASYWEARDGSSELLLWVVLRASVHFENVVNSQRRRYNLHICSGVTEDSALARCLPCQFLPKRDRVSAGRWNSRETLEDAS